MAKNLGCLKLFLWIGIVLFFLYFLIFTFAPQKMLAALSLFETHGLFLRLYGIFPLGWAILFLFALKDIEKNIAIINGAIITGFLVVISIVVFHFVQSVTGLFQWVSAVIMFIFSLLLLICKPKAAQ